MLTERLIFQNLVQYKGTTWRQSSLLIPLWMLLKDSPEQDDLAGRHHGETTLLLFPSYIVKHQEEILDEIAMNTLYELRINHSVIDVVGLIKDQIGTVFIQTLQQPYTKHSPCLIDLFNKNENVSGYDELSSDTLSLFAYYWY